MEAKRERERRGQNKTDKRGRDEQAATISTSTFSTSTNLLGVNLSFDVAVKPHSNSSRQVAKDVSQTYYDIMASSTMLVLWDCMSQLYLFTVVSSI